MNFDTASTDSRELVLTRLIEPSEKPFATVVLTFEEQAGKTRYTARVRHWTAAGR